MKDLETSIREYGEHLPVSISQENDRLVIKALNEAGYNETVVDLLDVIEYVKANMPELLK